MCLENPQVKGDFMDWMFSAPAIAGEDGFEVPHREPPLQAGIPLLTRFPARFLSAAISNRHGFQTRGFYLDEARRLGLRILPLDVNASHLAYHGKDDWIRPGLWPLGGCRESAMKVLWQEREANGPYADIIDLLGRVPLHRREAESLILAGGLGCFDMTRPELLRRLDAMLPGSGPGGGGDFCLMRNCLHELDLLGCAVSADLRDAVEIHSSARGTVRASDLRRHAEAGVRVAGIPLTQRLRPAFLGGENAETLCLGDATGRLKVGFRSRALERWEWESRGREPLAGYLLEVSGVVREAEGDLWVDAEEVRLAAWSPENVDFGIASRRMAEGLNTFPAYADQAGSLAA
jgi:hypothetical protein